MTILAVDDDHTSLALIEQAMRSDGHVLHSYESARVALEQLQNHRIVPDLILSDVRMPELDGAGFFREVRRLLPAIPFMYLTVVDDLEEVVALVRRGATDLVHKPINPGDLRMRVRCAMDEVERRQAVEQALRERELEKAEEHRMLSWKALYASKETRQVRDMIYSLSRSSNAAGGFDWVDLLDSMRSSHDEEHDLVPRAVIDLAVGSARAHQKLLARITRLGSLHEEAAVQESVGLAEMVGWFHDDLRPELQALCARHGRPVHLAVVGEIPSGARCVWDRSAVRDMLWELVCNAIKYSPAGSPVDVALEWVAGTRGSHARFQLRNVAAEATARDEHGRPIIGLPSHYAERVFEMFYMIEAFPTPFDDEEWSEGTGLYFVRTMARRLGGWAEIRSGVDYTAEEPRVQVLAELRLPEA